jgi:lantibiotic biosynthesis dehydratase-like protein
MSDESLSVHLAGSWWVWRDVAVRASGFAFDDLLQLGQPKLAMEADSEIDDEGFRAAYEAAVNDWSATLDDVVEGSTFRAAVLWQNPKIIHELIEPYLTTRRSGGARNSPLRQREIALAKYIQRYYAKNDSIGFFGPVGWAHWVDAVRGRRVSVTGYHGEIVSRCAQVELWAVQALAQQICADQQVRRWLRPAIAPTIKLAEGRVHSPALGWFGLPRPRIDVLAACDGSSTVIDIARRLLAAGVPGLTSVDDVDRTLGALERVGYVEYGLAIPPTLHPDRFLRRRLDEIRDDATRQRHGAMLDRIESAAARVSDSAGDPDRLSTALNDLAAVFTAETGEHPSRSHAGRLVSGRSLMVEDCRSSIEMTLPHSLLTELAEPLDLMLTSARWLVERVAERYLAILGDIHQGIAHGAARVGLAAVCSALWPRCTIEAMRAEAAPAVDELRRRWARILGPPVDARRHHVLSADIATAVHEQFAAASAPWLSGRVHSPDVMIAAAGIEAINRGEYEWVLGEMHSGHITLNQGVFVLSHPEPDRLRAMADEDARSGRQLIPIYPSDWPEISGRAYPPPYLVSDAYEYVRFAAEPPRDTMTGPGMPISALTMVRDPGGELGVEADDGRRWHPLAAVGEFMMGLAEVFQPFAPVPHRPRISIDRLVIAREQWQMPAGEIGWPRVHDEADRYRAARRWAMDLGLPRHVFVRLVGQRKPYYVDFTSPLMVNMIGSTLRVVARHDAATVVTVSEMHPGPDDLWLRHSAPDRRCTSELRLAIVDRGRTQAHEERR